ncbi:conserved hypothetical protein [Leishmania braziliensis MHOM/BR/75/M2904]|uniref:Uncharacterized protein n=1 Tax=Leishmania braziliensis TaxID=5660 RepID=A4HNC0_LEIBR|nr:conserved hypothetical protein [Leishmania braziliensis MHOM/BR/75/M2904]KAI5689518.1 hypothetical protein MNV84_07688 [Leishmania braziliensis]CAJ2480785.1 unnamed protein product [Leishmania braziliensis]CAJ2481074.1 unnamed protein product [Leishmania braziliensis]CAM43668.1 conserved hypothetical protein [Leishmania braziliensis MHOM/BR/75/M2904]
MTTVQDSLRSAPAAGAMEMQTLLPSTCGEEVDLPGVPRVGCVAAISYKPHSPHGFSVCVVGMADGIAILGPDLTQRHYGRHCLLTRHLWRPAALFEGSGEQPNATAHECGRAAQSRNGTAMLPHTKGSYASIVAVTACLVAGEDGNGANVALETAEDDTIAIVVAWSDAALHHHVTVLTAHLRCILTPSSKRCASSGSVHVEAGLVQVVAHDALPLHPMQSVLRLFYHSAMATSQNEIAPHHVVMCSVYSPLDWTMSPERHFGLSDPGATTNNTSPSSVVKPSHPNAGSGSAVAESVAPSAATAARGHGGLLFLTVSAFHDSDTAGEATASASASLKNACANNGIRVCAGPSAGKDVAPWLLQFQPDRIVCAFAVQSATTSVIAVAGTTDGRVYLLGQTSQRLVRRVSGPVADAMFVQTKLANVRSRTRNAVVDGLLNEAIEEDTRRSGGVLSQPDDYAPHDESDSAALVILESAGHLLVLRAINSDAPITQSVADISQVITLANGRQQTLTFVDSSMENLEESTHISSKSFLDLSSLRGFFGRRRPPVPPPPPEQHQRKLGRSDSSPTNAPLASSSLTTSPANQSFLNGAMGIEEIHIAGHILSRGLLCATCIYNAQGGAELVVSTMGQVVVSVPFSPTDGCFRIAGFTKMPAPMFYVGFVDFFAAGNPMLVMAGLKSVLVANRPQLTIRDRAQLLLRLLNKKECEQQAAESDGVDV